MIHCYLNIYYISCVYASLTSGGHMIPLGCPLPKKTELFSCVREYEATEFMAHSYHVGE